MNIDHDAAAALIAKGLLRALRKREYGNFSSALDHLFNFNAGSADAETDFLDQYEIAAPASEKLSRLLEGLRLASCGNSGAEAIADGLEGAKAAAALSDLALSAPAKDRCRIENAIMQLGAEELIGLNAGNISKLMASKPHLGIIDRLSLMLRPRRKYFSAENKDNPVLGLALAASLDDMVRKYVLFDKMCDNSMCNELFLGLASFVSQRSAVRMDFDFGNESRLNFLLDAYGFEGMESERVRAIWEKFAAFAERRSKFLAIQPALIDDFTGVLAYREKIPILLSTAANLQVYSITKPETLKMLYDFANSTLRPETPEAKQMWETMVAVAKEHIPGIYVNENGNIWHQFHKTGHQIMQFQNFCSEMNEFAIQRCTGAQGSLSTKYARSFLSKYFSTAIPPFDKEKITALLD